MKYSGRNKENIKYGLIVVIGLICLYCITVNLRDIEASIEVVEAEEIEEQLITLEEKNIEIEMNTLYESMNGVVSQEEVSKVVTQVLGESYPYEIEIVRKHQFYGVTIIYDETNKEQALSKGKKEQVALLDACLLMSLFDDIDVVTIKSIRGDTYYEKVIYRPDIEDYFGISLEAINNKNTFVRVANEFLSSEAVSRYWNMKHPYDSQLGEAVEKFYKCNFGSEWEENENLPYIDETLGEELVEQYGYKFFIQGLNYEHPLMNYYAAYRLIEYYGNSNIDEILLELASCRNESNIEEVQVACTFAMNVLSRQLEEDEVFIFTRYGESELQGGEKLYGIVGGEFIEIALWQGEESGGFEVIGVSSDKESVLCKVHTLEKSYLYMIPIDSIGSYVVNEMTVQKGEQIISREISNLMKDVALDKEVGSEGIEAIDEGDFQIEWLFQKVLLLWVSEEERFVYDGSRGILVDEGLFNQKFDVDYLMQGLKESFEDVTMIVIADHNEAYEIKEIDIYNQKLLVHEYDSEMQKYMDLLKEKEEERQLEKGWSKGKLYVTYSGNQPDIISLLNKIMVE